MDNWLLIIVGVIFLISIVAGYVRGLLKIGISLLATVLSIVLVMFLAPYVSDALIKWTPADEMIEETARHLMRMMGKNVIYYRAEDGILSEPRFCMAESGAAKMLYLQQRERQAAQWVFENRNAQDRNGSVSGCTLPVSGNPKRRHGLWRDRNCSGRDDDGCL